MNEFAGVCLHADTQNITHTYINLPTALKIQFIRDSLSPVVFSYNINLNVSTVNPTGFCREACFSFRSVPCILIKVSVGGKSSQTARLLPLSCFVGTGLLTHTWVSDGTKQRDKKLHNFLLLLRLPFLSQDYKKTRGLYTLPLCPFQTPQPMGFFMTAHILQFTSTAIESAWKRTICSAERPAVSLKAALCGSDRREVFCYCWHNAKLSLISGF